MTTIPVVYAQGLFGERWRYYGAWAKYVPVPLLERLGSRLPAKQLWEELISCGDRQAQLSVLAGSTVVAESAGFWASEVKAPVVLSHNLGVGKDWRNRWRGRTLALGLLRKVLPALARELELFGDRLVIGLAVAEWERSFWVMGIEPYARAIIVFLHKNERSQSYSGTGLAVRQTAYVSGKVDAHLLIVSPECIEATSGLAMRQGTVVISTDGLPISTLAGCFAIDLGMSGQMGLPAVIWADRRDELPVLEAVVTTVFSVAQMPRWPTHPARQMMAMDQALAWSEWPVVYKLQRESSQLT
jgi:hypothetical protein